MIASERLFHLILSTTLCILAVKITNILPWPSREKINTQTRAPQTHTSDRNSIQPRIEYTKATNDRYRCSREWREKVNILAPPQDGVTLRNFCCLPLRKKTRKRRRNKVKKAKLKQKRERKRKSFWTSRSNRNERRRRKSNKKYWTLAMSD